MSGNFFHTVISLTWSQKVTSLILRSQHRTDNSNPEHPQRREKERCSGSYCQAVGFLVIKDDSISERPG
jgi:hypothetical protein